MFDALRTATAGMTAAANQAAVAAEAIASPEQPAQGASDASGAQTPRIGYLPVAADPISAFTTLFAAEFAFKANAAVFRSAERMVEALYKATD